ncbi:MAG: hypothetical protein H7X80_09975, partial [bacterium]|nr:hypothetical protein [Candidatus Kapabacteria bacterium]
SRDATRGDSVASDTKLRLLLVGTASQDSVRMVDDFHVDQVLRQIFDSVKGATYLTLNFRDSLALKKDPTGAKGIALKELAGKLDLDAGINVALARFGSVLAVEFQVIDAATGATRFRDLVFQLIRYRDTSGTMLIGPALYDALRTAVGRFVARTHDKTTRVASEPVVLTGFVIPSDPGLMQISKTRDATSRSLLAALHDYAGMHFPELVTFDAASRDRLYQTVRIGSVANYMEPRAAERQALFNVGVDRYLLGSVTPASGDSMRLRLELRSIVSPALDTLELVEEMVQPIAMFSSSDFEEDLIVATLDLAEPLFKQASDSVKSRYERARKARGAATPRKN